MVKAALGVPFPVLYPTLQTGQAEQQQVRAYTLKDQQGNLHHAYVVVWQQNAIGGYYDFEGTDWLNPPLFAHARIAARSTGAPTGSSTTASTSTSSAGARATSSTG